MRKILAGLAIGAGASALVLLLGWTGWLETLELKTYDWRMRQAYRLAERQASAPFPINADIVLVEINDASIRDLSPLVGRWPWPRALHALLVSYLARGPARVVAVDIGFWEPERPASYEFLGNTITSRESDEALAAAVQRAGNVILLADAVNPGLVGGEPPPATAWNAPPYQLGPSIEERPVVTLPYESLASAAIGFGHNFLVIDRDGPARRISPFIRHGSRFMPSLGLAAALAALNARPEAVVLEDEGIRVGAGRIPLVRQGVREGSAVREQQMMLINYRTPLQNDRGERPFTTYEARHLLLSEGQIQEGEKPFVDPAAFKDKIVFVGLTAAGLLDVFQSPHGGSLIPGIQLHASVTDSVLSHLYITQAAGWTRVAGVTAIALTVGLMSAALPFAAAGAGAVTLAGAWGGLALWTFRQGLWIDMTAPLLVVAVSMFAGTAYRYFVEGREKRKVKRLFGRYVSKDVYTQLLANPGLAELGGRRRDMTVLFSDIRGFTAITENGDPEDLVAQLNEYFTRMVDIVFRNHGTVDKFVGDMVMALFSAPLDDSDHAEHGVAAAQEMVAALGELNRKWSAEGRAALDIGIGINSGDMIAGNIGSSSIMSYTVIGDNVNLASRLESLNKDYRTRIIISEATRGRLTGRYEIRPLGGVVVKGKTKPVEIFEVCVPSPLPAQATPEPVREKVQQAL